jgi:hypothetical protein
VQLKAKNVKVPTEYRNIKIWRHWQTSCCYTGLSWGGTVLSMLRSKGNPHRLGYSKFLWPFSWKIRVLCIGISEGDDPKRFWGNVGHDNTSTTQYHKNTWADKHYTWYIGISLDFNCLVYRQHSANFMVVTRSYLSLQPFRGHMLSDMFHTNC